MTKDAGSGGAAADRAAAGAKLPLFLLSFHYRNELVPLIERSGRQVIAARRAEAAGRRFTAAGATIAVIDARDAADEAADACARMSAPGRRCW